LGIKPLFVTEQRGGLAFASEISALRVLPDHDFDIARRGIEDFFRFGHVLGPRTIFREVRQLEPGHFLRIGPNGPSVTRRYWQPRVNVDRSLSEREWVEETRRRVLDTVGQHMLSDVPVGAFLSGGVDSGSIVAAMARASGPGFTAFTAGFPGSRIDETAAARSIADHVGCKHVVLPIEPETAAEILPAVQRSFDEPTAANSAIPLWYLSRAASQQVKVVLCGEGGGRAVPRLQSPALGRADAALGPASTGTWRNGLRLAYSRPSQSEAQLSSRPGAAVSGWGIVQ
jgi:asparagine synthase (glutamine-hydrolysing)